MDDAILNLWFSILVGAASVGIYLKIKQLQHEGVIKSKKSRKPYKVRSNR